MSYRIWLHTSENRRLELYDRLNLKSFPTIKETKEDEYPSHEIYKSDLKDILLQYQHLLRDNAERKIENQTPVFKNIQHYNEYCYFKKLIDNELLIQDSDSFLLQYFYLVDIYKKMNNETYFKITHG